MAPSLGLRLEHSYTTGVLTTDWRLFDYSAQYDLAFGGQRITVDPGGTHDGVMDVAIPPSEMLERIQAASSPGLRPAMRVTNFDLGNGIMYLHWSGLETRSLFFTAPHLLSISVCGDIYIHMFLGRDHVTFDLTNLVYPAPSNSAESGQEAGPSDEGEAQGEDKPILFPVALATRPGTREDMGKTPALSGENQRESRGTQGDNFTAAPPLVMFTVCSMGADTGLVRTVVDVDQLLGAWRSGQAGKNPSEKLAHTVSTLFSSGSAGQGLSVASSDYSPQVRAAVSSSRVGSIPGAPCSITWLGCVCAEDIEVFAAVPGAGSAGPNGQREVPVAGECVDVLLLVVQRAIYLLYVSQSGAFSSVDLLRSQTLPPQASRTRVAARHDVPAASLDGAEYSRDVAFATADGGVLHFSVDLRNGLMDGMEILNFKGSKSVKYFLHANSTDPSSGAESSAKNCPTGPGIVTWGEYAHVYAGVMTLAARELGSLPGGSLRVDSESLLPSAAASVYPEAGVPQPVPEMISGEVAEQSLISYFAALGFPVWVEADQLELRARNGRNSHGKRIKLCCASGLSGKPSVLLSMRALEAEAIKELQADASPREISDGAQRKTATEYFCSRTVTVPTESAIGSVDIQDVVIEDNRLFCLTSSGSYISIPFSGDTVCECTQLLHIPISPLSAGPVALSLSVEEETSKHGQAISFFGPELPILCNSVRSRGAYPVGFAVRSRFPFTLSVLLNINELQGLNGQTMLLTTPYTTNRGTQDVSQVVQKALEFPSHGGFRQPLLQNLVWLLPPPLAQAVSLETDFGVSSHEWVSDAAIADSLKQRVDLLVNQLVARAGACSNSAAWLSESSEDVLTLGRGLSILRHLGRDELLPVPVSELYSLLQRCWDVENPAVASISKGDAGKADEPSGSGPLSALLSDALESEVGVCAFTGQPVLEIPSLVCRNRRCGRVMSSTVRQKICDMDSSTSFRWALTALFGTLSGACPVCGGSFGFLD